ncbi:hypothetical protein FOZ63_003212, partial [Perkinsus olseni]
MALPTSIVLLLVLGGVPFTVAPRVKDVPVLLHELPTGTYWASTEGSQQLCPTLPLLTTFSLEVSESGGQSTAIASAMVDGHRVVMENKCHLLWKAEFHSSDMSIKPHHFTDAEKTCFQFKSNAAWGLSEAGKFMRALYFNLGRDVSPRVALELAFCKTRSGLMVGIGIVKNKGLITGFENSFLLSTSLNQGASEDGPPSLPNAPAWEYKLPSGEYRVARRDAGKSEGCFCFVEDEAREAFEFVCKLYGAMGEPIPKQRRGHHLAICGTSSVILIGLKAEKNKSGRLTGFSDTIFLEGPLTSIVGGKVGGLVSVKQTSSSGRKRKGSSNSADHAKRRHVNKYNPVVEDQLASGMYRAKKQGGVCPTLPSLTGFEVEVSRSDGQQVAIVNAQ